MYKFIKKIHEHKIFHILPNINPLSSTTKLLYIQTEQDINSLKKPTSTKFSTFSQTSTHFHRTTKLHPHQTTYKHIKKTHQHKIFHIFPNINPLPPNNKPKIRPENHSQHKRSVPRSATGPQTKFRPWLLSRGWREGPSRNSSSSSIRRTT